MTTFGLIYEESEGIYGSGWICCQVHELKTRLVSELGSSESNEKLLNVKQPRTLSPPSTAVVIVHAYRTSRLNYPAIFISKN